MASPTVFTWNASTWGTDEMMWTSPGVYPTAGAGSAETDSSAVPLVIAGVEGTADAVTDSAVITTNLVAPAGTDVYVTATSARWYEQLPPVYRNRDAEQGSSRPGGFDGGDVFDGGGEYDIEQSSPDPDDFPMLRWFASMIDQAGELEALIDRFSDPTASALTDPALADEAWLPWLARLLGRQVTVPVADLAVTRQSLAGAFTGTQPGTKPAIEQTVAAVLTGTKTVTVTDHYDADPWQIEVATLTAETPASVAGQYGFQWGVSEWGLTTRWGDPDPLVWLLETTDTKPAGYKLVHTTA